MTEHDDDGGPADEQRGPAGGHGDDEEWRRQGREIRDGLVAILCGLCVAGGYLLGVLTAAAGVRAFISTPLAVLVGSGVWAYLRYPRRR